uniref:Uncharacterized protein n=1 Tax=Anopheles minimus TaxID=112268 RepID=A0A182WID2_9DIPT
MNPAVNFIRSAGKKVIVEYGERIYSIPQQDFLHRHPSKTFNMPINSDPGLHQQHESKFDKCYAAKKHDDRVLSDTLSELSDSNMSNDRYTPEATNPVNPLVSSSAAKVLSELKEEVTRLIDESILKIEHEWVQNKQAANNGACEPEAPVPTMDMEKCVEEPSKTLHPDGDRGQLTHREQNLQVLHTELFGTSKRQTRMKLLNEIRALVERLKDLEMLEE